LNVEKCTYENTAINLLPPSCRDSLPDLADYADYVQGIPKDIPQSGGREQTPEPNPYWTQFPELQDCKFFLGIGDGACANVGSKCTTASRIAVTIGTSAAARMCFHHDATLSTSPFFFSIPAFHGLFCYRIDKSHVLVGGALTDGGSVVEWARHFLNLRDEQAFQDCLNQVQALVEQERAAVNHEAHERSNQRELSLVPFLSGERSTGFRDGATGAAFGLTRETTPAHFFKSCLEGVSLRLKAVLELIVASRETDEAPVIIGSGRAMECNDLWRQMIADSSGLRVVFDADTEEGTSRGAAQLVAIAMAHPTKNKLSSYEETLRPSRTSQPRPEMAALYDRKAGRQTEFIDSIAPLFSKKL
jgi:gluconokinase